MESPKDRHDAGIPTEPSIAAASTTTAASTTNTTAAAATGDEIMRVAGKRRAAGVFISIQSLIDLARRGKRPINRAGIENN
jgi:hypothetical protein